MNDYVVIIRSPDHPNIQIEFKIPHSRTAEVVNYLAQFKHDIVRVTSHDWMKTDGPAPEGYI